MAGEPTLIATFDSPVGMLAISIDAPMAVIARLTVPAVAVLLQLKFVDAAESEIHAPPASPVIVMLWAFVDKGVLDDPAATWNEGVEPKLIVRAGVSIANPGEA